MSTQLFCEIVIALSCKKVQLVHSLLADRTGRYWRRLLCGGAGPSLHDEMSEYDGATVEWLETRRSRRKTCPHATLSTTNPTWSDLGAYPGLRNERPVTNRPSHVTSSVLYIVVTCKRVFCAMPGTWSSVLTTLRSSECTNFQSETWHRCNQRWHRLTVLFVSVSEDEFCNSYAGFATHKHPNPHLSPPRILKVGHFRYRVLAFARSEEVQTICNEMQERNSWPAVFSVYLYHVIFVPYEIPGFVCQLYSTVFKNSLREML
jgi:hypothetical protein